MTPTDRRLAFLIEFSGLPLERYKSESLLEAAKTPVLVRLRKDLQAFLSGDPGRVREANGEVWGIVPQLSGDIRHKIAALSFAELVELHAEVKEFLLHALEEKARVRATVPQTIQLSLWFPKKGRFLTLRSETLVDHFRLILHLLTVRGADQKLRRCVAPDCGKVFVRYRKKMFCSTQCGDRDRQKRHRTLLK
jgi:hypothetical protein